MKLQQLTLERLDAIASRKQIKNSLKQLISVAPDQDKIYLYNTYFWICNLTELDVPNYTQICTERYYYIQKSLDAIKKNSRDCFRCKSDQCTICIDEATCSGIIGVLEFIIDYISKDVKVIKLAG